MRRRGLRASGRRRGATGPRRRRRRRQAASHGWSKPRPASASTTPADGEQLRALLELAQAGEADPVRRRRSADLVQLLRREHLGGVEAALHGDERLRDRRDGTACRRCARSPSAPPRARGPGRYGLSVVIASKLSATIRKCDGERQVVAADAVVAVAVDPLVMQLDGACLGATNSKRCSSRADRRGMAAHRGPLGLVEAAALAQQRRVDRDLAEVVQPARPSAGGRCRRTEAAARVRARRRSRRRAANGVGGRVALVDDVRERLERAQRLALQAAQCAAATGARRSRAGSGRRRSTDGRSRAARALRRARPRPRSTTSCGSKLSRARTTSRSSARTVR